MSQAQTIADALYQAVGSKSSTAVVHSSLAALRPPADLSRWDLLRAVRSLVDRGLTLAFPAFTFGFCRGAPYHATGSRSETGILADWVVELHDSIRSPNPIYSFVLIGPQAQRLAACPNTTTFGEDSIFAEFERQNAQMVMAGCDLSYCTQFHRYEEEAGVPYRYYKNFTGSADFGSGPSLTNVKMFVRDLKIDPENNFSPAVNALRRDGQIATVELWGGQIESVACSSLAEKCRSLLAVDQLALVVAPEQVRHAIKNAKASARTQPFCVELLGNANLAILGKWLKTSLESLLPDRVVEVVSPPFGQLAQFADRVPIPGEQSPDICIFADRLEDLTGAFTLDQFDRERLNDAFEHYVATLKRHRERRSGAIIVATFANLLPSGLGAIDTNARSISALVDMYNKRLSAVVTPMPDVYLFDLNRAAACRQSASAVDARLWHIGRFPFSDEFSRELAREWSGLILASIGKTARLIIVDLDNTLWGGVLGEDGVDGLMIGGDFPGNAFQSFQRTLLSLHARGVLLAVCSKNDHDDAMAALRDHPDMLLRPDHFAALRINWEPKWRNIQAICDELDLDTANALFLDDNPAERALVRRELPSVPILDLSNDPTSYSEMLLRSPWVGSLKVTESDLKRPRQYIARRKVQERRTTFDDPTSFYASLKIRIGLSNIDDFNGARAVQLSTKTNQFNTTTRRYQRTDLEARASERDRVLVIGLEDLFSEFENIGLLVLRADHPDPRSLFIDNYLLSCRILGRGVEVGLLHWLCAAARAEGFGNLVGQIVEMPRNQPVRCVFKDANFQQDAATGLWTIALDAQSPVCPSWLRVSITGSLFEKKKILVS
jgi:FkbH-like protein